MLLQTLRLANYTQVVSNNHEKPTTIDKLYLPSIHHIYYINKLMIACMRTLQLKGMYRFAQVRLYKPHLERYFENNPALIEKQMKEISKKYSLNKKAAERLFRLKPQVFIPGTQERAEIESKIIFLNKLEETQPVATVLNDLLFDNRHLIMSMNQEKILEFIETIKEIGLNDKTAVKLLTSSPNLIHNKFDVLYQEKLVILTDYLQLTPEQALEIFLNQPFLLNCSSDRLRQTICYMVERQNKVLTREKIIGLLKNLGEVFLIGREQLSQMIQWYSSWGIQRQQLWSILLQHPLLLLNHPAEVFHFKIKMFRQFRFTVDMGQQMLRKYPSILICSVRSLESKFLCARDRLKINITPHNLEFLSFKFMANIRPRSEMLIRGKIPYTSQDIVDYLKCSQKEFLARTKIPEEKLAEEKGKYLITTELDIPRKKSLKSYSSEKKIFQYSARYYSKQDLILKQK